MEKLQTKLLSDSDEDIGFAADIIKRGGIVAIPTETVYGLAANTLDPTAVSKIFTAKGRPNDNPLIVHISELSQIKELVLDFPKEAKLLADAFWPGPLTIILPKTHIVPPEVTAGLQTVAIRMPSHTVARKIIAKSGVSLSAPSANTAGKPSPTTAMHVLNDLNGKIDAIVDGGKCDVGVESTVITLTGDVPTLLRPGKVTLEELQNVIGNVQVDSAVTNKLESGKVAASPGMKYKHYSPMANVIIVKGNKEAYTNFVNARKNDNVAALCFYEDVASLNVPVFPFGGENDYGTQARLLFEMLRKIDESNIDVVYARCPKTQDVGLAVYNRLIRAAGFEVIDLE